MLAVPVVRLELEVLMPANVDGDSVRSHGAHGRIVELSVVAYHNPDKVTGALDLPEGRPQELEQYLGVRSGLVLAEPPKKVIRQARVIEVPFRIQGSTAAFCAGIGGAVGAVGQHPLERVEGG